MSIFGKRKCIRLICSYLLASSRGIYLCVTCTQRVHNVYTTYTQRVYVLSAQTPLLPPAVSICAQSVYTSYLLISVYTTCTQRVHNVYTACTQRVHNVYTSYSAHHPCSLARHHTITQVGECVDLGVYSRNRCFRLFNSTKFGKNTTFLV
jgi:hypothetical protein